MMSVRPHNKPNKSSHANSRADKKEKNKSHEAAARSNMSRSKNKTKQSHCAIDNNDTNSSIVELTINTGLVNRKNNQDTKPTTKKNGFESKPIIRELTKKLANYSKQYAPQYFINILEYIIEKETRSTISPTISKINQWRKLIELEKAVQAHVDRVVSKIANNIATSRKKFKEGIQYQKNYDAYQHMKQVKSQKQSYKNGYNGSSSESSGNSSLSSSIEISNVSCPPLHQGCPQNCFLIQNEQQFNRSWEIRFEKFAQFIQNIYKILSQDPWQNTIVPACYIFFAICSSDITIFDLLNQDSQKPNQTTLSYRNVPDSNKIHPKKSSQPSSLEIIQYYTIASVMIASKYHEVYAASLEDLIEAINPKLSYDYAIKIQARILQMLNFKQFYGDNQLAIVRILLILVGWGKTQTNICEFIIESGLNNPNIYMYSPLYKAAAVIGMYEEIFLKSQQKFMQIKTLIPNLTLELFEKIRKQYAIVLLFNQKNKLCMQKKKYYIFDNQLKKMMCR